MSWHFFPIASVPPGAYPCGTGSAIKRGVSVEMSQAQRHGTIAFHESHLCIVHLRCNEALFRILYVQYLPSVSQGCSQMSPMNMVGNFIGKETSMTLTMLGS